MATFILRTAHIDGSYRKIAKMAFLRLLRQELRGRRGIVCKADARQQVLLVQALSVPPPLEGSGLRDHWPKALPPLFAGQKVVHGVACLLVH